MKKNSQYLVVDCSKLSLKSFSSCSCDSSLPTTLRGVIVLIAQSVLLLEHRQSDTQKELSTWAATW